MKLLDPPRPDGFHCWTAAELAQFEAHHPIGSKARLACALLFYTGCRRADVVGLGPKSVRRDGKLSFVPHQGRRKSADPLVINIAPELQAIIEASSSVIGTAMWLETWNGKPFTSNGFGNWFGDQCRGAGLPHCSAPGLRKARAVHYAHRGASTAQLKARFGWSTDSMAAKYIKTANQEHFADMIEELPARRQRVPTGGN